MKNHSAATVTIMATVTCRRYMHREKIFVTFSVRRNVENHHDENKLHSLIPLFKCIPHTYIPTQLACFLSMRVSVTINITSKVQRDRDGQAFLFFVTFLTSVYSEGQVCVYLYPS